MTAEAQRLLDPTQFERYQSQPDVGIEGVRDTQWRFMRLGLSRYLRPSDRVLDIGCNEGAMSFELSRYVREVVALDAHAPFIARAQELAERMRIRNCKFIPKPFNSAELEGPFDVILSLAVHYWMPDLRQYMNRLKSLTKPAGIIVIESHNLAEERHLQDWVVLRSCLEDCQLLASGDLSDEVVKAPEIREYVRKFEIWRRPPCMM
jgi:2-polyprenyl-3-methyl-5-hydroxy-6-metoxy-1,4-benzoquinol methylase